MMAEDVEELDLVDELRSEASSGVHPYTKNLLERAATEIERLRTLNRNISR